MNQLNKDKYLQNSNGENANRTTSTNTQASNTALDLSKYGIDFSEQRREEIANIFRSQADSAYRTAQNQYSSQMASQQASLNDSIRRSQAEAVATGASRGMTAAQQLSNMLGLQQEAATGATTLQGNYATEYAKASQEAMNMQNKQAEIGSNLYSADAQKYVADREYDANDFMRVIREASELRAQGRNNEAEMLLKNAMSANGVWDPNSASNAVQGITKTDPKSGEQYDWTPEQRTLIESDSSNSRTAFTNTKGRDGENFDNKGDIGKGQGADFFIGTNKVEADKAAPKETQKELSTAYPNLNEGNVVYYKGNLYVATGDGGWRGVRPKSGSNKNIKAYESALEMVKNNAG